MTFSAIIFDYFPRRSRAFQAATHTHQFSLPPLAAFDTLAVCIFINSNVTREISQLLALEILRKKLSLQLKRKFWVSARVRV